MKRPFMLWHLITILILLSLWGFSGGIPMLADTISAGYLDFEYLLPQLPVSNFILPGLFLISFMGLFPLLLIYTSIARPIYNWLKNCSIGASIIFALIVAKWPTVDRMGS